LHKSKANYPICQKLGAGADVRDPPAFASFDKPVLMTPERRSYTLDSTLETVDSAEHTATQIANDCGFAEDEVLQIAMAVREAAVNAVLHGNAYDPDKKVKLDFERTGQDLVITIRDQG
jgi:serine/threonine-protein kinase RsbW